MSPRVFIGTSTEGKDLGRAVISVLREQGLSVRPWWKPGVFAPGQSFLSSVQQAVRDCDAALFVATPDVFSINNRRRLSSWTANGNVILEYGMFVAARGRRRTVLALVEDVALPTDLKGISQIPLTVGRRSPQQRLPVFTRKSIAALSEWSRSLFLIPPEDTQLFRCLTLEDGVSYVSDCLKGVKATLDHAAFSPPLPSWDTDAGDYRRAMESVLTQNRIYYRYLAGVGTDPFRLNGIQKQLDAYRLRPDESVRRYSPRVMFQIGRRTDISFQIFDESLLVVYVPGMEGSPGSCFVSKSPEMVRRYQTYYDALWSHGIFLSRPDQIGAMRLVHDNCARELRNVMNA